MNIFLILALFIINQPLMILYDFEASNKPLGWVVVDDNVMGGRSEGNISVNEKGYGIYEGEVSLENNGGFSSIRYGFEPINVEAYKIAQLLC
jgi:NADH dehydrogenase [ubiquinone] 1 alpha subcomplex assembly factor 1